jgi:hypothetical protein
MTVLTVMSLLNRKCSSESLKRFEVSLGFGVWPLGFFCVIMIGLTV